MIPELPALFTELTRQQLTLSLWEEVSAERELQGVLERASALVLPLVSFVSMAVIAFEGEKHDVYAFHVPERPRAAGETIQQYMTRPEFHANPKLDLPPRPVIAYEVDSIARARTGTPYVCNDLLEKEVWYEHEQKLAEGGVRAYVSIPLLVGGRVIGALVFFRIEPEPFEAPQVQLLRDISRPIAVAVVNALANEQIRRLRDQLQAENLELRAQLGQAPWFEEIVGESPALRRVLESVEQVAATDATVLVQGETGTGKELIARALHRRSERRQGPLVKVNCAAIPDALLASELFGHERGAFTGATERRRGRFEQAHGGTLFLDEIGEMSLETQVLLLRVLQEREFERLGGSQTVQVDVRLVVATHQDLEQRVAAGAFRADLYYRLNVFPVRMPSLRERTADIPALVAHFAQKYGQRFGRTIETIDAESLKRLQRHGWPGNVRELENTVERAVILSRRGTLVIDAGMLQSASSGARPSESAAPLREGIAASERQAIEEALRAARGRVSGPRGAARRLGLPASTLEFRIRRLGIDKHQFRQSGPV